MDKTQAIDVRNEKLPAGLYLVATPIGNLRDITLRALDVLTAADAVLCEDSRVSGKLMQAYGLKKKLVVYNDHSGPRDRGRIVSLLTQGNALALISDAGTPLIADPGYKLVRDCLDQGLAVTPIPGPNATLGALQLSGLPSDRFSFLGFLPPKSAARRTALQDWVAVPGTLVTFETGPRLLASLRDMAEVLGDRAAAVVREITKRHEESRRGTLSDLAAFYETEGPPKGEIVVVIAPPEAAVWSDAALEEALRDALKTMSVKDAAASVAKRTGVPRRKLYDRGAALAKNGL
ncbi:MAG: 16S rRNA (cytidine(1402)-2'-O)-methyltransferase [Alphaproteobacteria bacterium]|nr:16S rRNA (cytidine(1402)-2'-O)-methyltransferase [Alphaproteobacteria bacterium]